MIVDLDSMIGLYGITHSPRRCLDSSAQYGGNFKRNNTIGM